MLGYIFIRIMYLKLNVMLQVRGSGTFLSLYFILSNFVRGIFHDIRCLDVFLVDALFTILDICILSRPSVMILDVCMILSSLFVHDIRCLKCILGSPSAHE